MKMKGDDIFGIIGIVGGVIMGIVAIVVFQKLVQGIMLISVGIAMLMLIAYKNENENKNNR